MTPKQTRLLLALCAALQGALMVAITVLARSGVAPSIVVWVLGAAFFVYAGAVVVLMKGAASTLGVRSAVLVALAFGVPLLCAPPVLSDDLYRYLWEGQLWLEGFNPYALAPDDPALSSLRGSLWSNINNKELTSIYPPLSQALFVIAAWVGDRIWSIKVLALVGHAVSTAVVGRIAGARAAWLLGLNPLLVAESALNGHFDIWVGTALLVGVWAVSRQRFVRAGLSLCAAVGLKMVGIVLLPLLWADRKVFGLSLVASALLLAPLVRRAAGNPWSGLGQYATRWQGNESVFGVVDWAVRPFVSPEHASLAARAVCGALLVGIVLLSLPRRPSPFDSARAWLWAVLLLSPQMHPWYLAWLLPLEVAAGGLAGLVWSAMVLVAYAPLDRWVGEGVWQMPLSLRIVEYAVVFGSLWLDPRRPRMLRDGATTSETVFPDSFQ
jgi:hypothetical protein